MLKFSQFSQPRYFDSKASNLMTNTTIFLSKDWKYVEFKIFIQLMAIIYLSRLSV